MSYNDLFKQIGSAFDKNFAGSNVPEEAIYNERAEKTWQKDGWVHTEAIYPEGRVFDRYEVPVDDKNNIVAERMCEQGFFGGLSCKSSFSYGLKGNEQPLFIQGDSFSTYCDSSIIALCTQGETNKDASKAFREGLKNILPEVDIRIQLCYSGFHGMHCLILEKE